MTHDWKHLEDPKYDYSHLALATLYVALWGYAAWTLIRLFRGIANMIRWQKAFCWLVFFGGIIRSFAFSVMVPVREGFWQSVMPNRTMFLIQYIPSVLFYVAYLIVLFLWAEIYHTTNKQDLRDPSLQISRLLPVFKGVVGTICFAFFTLFAIDFATYKTWFELVAKHTNIAEESVVVLMASLYLLSSIAFLLYGTRFYLELKKAGSPIFTVETRRQRIVLEVQIITSVCTVCELVRGIVTLYQIFTVEPISGYWWVDPVYYTFLEVGPLLMLMRILRPRTATPTYKRSEDFAPIINTSY